MRKEGTSKERNRKVFPVRTMKGLVGSNPTDPTMNLFHWVVSCGGAAVQEWWRIAV